MRFLRRFLLSVAVLLVLALVGVWFYLDFATQRALEDGGRQMLGVETRVGSVGVQPLTGSIRLADIRIANPIGFSENPFLEVGKGRVDVVVTSLTTDEVEIASIDLSDLVLRLEKPGARANYESIGDSDSEPSPSARSIVVRKLTLRNVTAHVDEAVHGRGTGDLVLEIPEISLRDLGSDSDGDLIAAELSEVVIAAIVNALLKKGLSLPIGLVNDVGIIPVEVTGEVLKGVGGVADAGTRALEDVIGGTVGTAGKGVERAAEALGSIFGMRGSERE